ncbi:GHMP kinase [Halovivax asiaticus JCM 14624]|uniref:Pantoate kinase n=1 Tax=Halovivax asiaticus JCM 14624 TaxID=1227490 RepID=M0BUE1_9EURY|nr:pantoate kinase [Halovivax asiaticus]ELZ13742.1 GHMP kinase [Halovivax asiaticus JCM 14624]
MGEAVSAFVPGHITGFFTTQPDPDPTKAGSRGAGLTLSDGVSVTVQPDDATTIVLNGEAVEMAPVERVLDALEVTAQVEATAAVPLGAGFGVSGGLSLGAALAANRVFERGLSTNELVTIAHGAEVQSGTGLGDVVAQARGGIPIRLEPGSPPHGTLDGIPDRARVEYVSFGELSTADVLTGETDHITQAGQTALSRVVSEPTLGSFIYASREFARETDLLTPTVTEAIRAVSEAGGQASMAMLGETVFALGTGLSDAGYDPEWCVTHPAGATLE